MRQKHWTSLAQRGLRHRPLQEREPINGGHAGIANGRQPRRRRPEQSREAVVERGFHCQFNGPPFYGEFCTLNPETGDFSEIQADISPNTGMVSRLVFKPRENELAVGTLTLLWGQPEVKLYGQTANLRWHDLHIVAVPQGYRAHAPYLLPATYVAFESAD